MAAWLFSSGCIEHGVLGKELGHQAVGYLLADRGGALRGDGGGEGQDSGLPLPGDLGVLDERQGDSDLGTCGGLVGEGGQGHGLTQGGQHPHRALRVVVVVALMRVLVVMVVVLVLMQVSVLVVVVQGELMVVIVRVHVGAVLVVVVLVGHITAVVMRLGVVSVHMVMPMPVVMGVVVSVRGAMPVPVIMRVVVLSVLSMRVRLLMLLVAFGVIMHVVVVVPGTSAGVGVAVVGLSSQQVVLLLPLSSLKNTGRKHSPTVRNMERTETVKEQLWTSLVSFVNLITQGILVVH